MHASVSRSAFRWNVQHVALLPLVASPHQRPLVVVYPDLPISVGIDERAGPPDCHRTTVFDYAIQSEISPEYPVWRIAVRRI